MSGEASKIVDQVCVSFNSSLSDYDSYDKISSRSSMVPYSSCSTNGTNPMTNYSKKPYISSASN